MALTETQQKALIATQLGKSGDSAFASMVTDLYSLYAPQAAVHWQLRFLLTKRDAIGYLMGNLADQVDWKEGDRSVSNSQRLKNLHLLLEPLDAQIKALQHLPVNGAAVVVGQIARQAPIERADLPSAPPEPHDRTYRGDPLLPEWPARR